RVARMNLVVPSALMNGATTITVHQQDNTTSISLPSKDNTASVLDRWAFLLTFIVITLLSVCHLYYVISSRMVPRTDQAHYMSWVLSMAQGIRTGTLSGEWNGYQNAFGFKPPLVCVPAAVLMLLGGLTLPCMLSLVLTSAALGFASYSLFRHCLRPFHA